MENMCIFLYVCIYIRCAENMGKQKTGNSLLQELFSISPLHIFCIKYFFLSAHSYGGCYWSTLVANNTHTHIPTSTPLQTYCVSVYTQPEEVRKSRRKNMIPDIRLPHIFIFIKKKNSCRLFALKVYPHEPER